MKPIKKFIKDETNKIAIIGEFDKVVSADKYEILFNTKRGVEVLRGVNRNDDPKVLNYPSMIDVGIMGHCKNNCSFCYQGDKHQPNMELNDFKYLVDISKDNVNQFALGGRGDPNLHEDFEEIMKYSRENNIVPNFTTSGIGLTQKQVEIAKEYAGAVAVSDYGKPFTYKAIDMLIKAGIKTNIHMIFSRQSANKSIDLIKGEDTFKGSVDLDKLNAIIFLLFKPQGKGSNLKFLIPTNNQLEQFSLSIKKPNSKFKIGMDSCLVNHVSRHRKLSNSEKIMTDTCEGARMSCYVTPDLKLIPCSFGDHNLYGESIKDKTFQEIWNNGKHFINFRRKLSESCNVCPFECNWEE